VACPAAASCPQGRKKNALAAFFVGLPPPPYPGGRARLTWLPCTILRGNYHLNAHGLSRPPFTPPACATPANLFHDYVENFSRLPEILRSSQPELHSAETYAPQLNFPANRPHGKCAAILAPDNLSFGNAARNGKAICGALEIMGGGPPLSVGQQVGLFGGRRRLVYKALTGHLIRRVELSACPALEAVRSVWMAT